MSLHISFSVCTNKQVPLIQVWIRYETYVCIYPCAWLYRDKYPANWCWPESTSSSRIPPKMLSCPTFNSLSETEHRGTCLAKEGSALVCGDKAWHAHLQASRLSCLPSWEVMWGHDISWDSQGSLGSFTGSILRAKLIWRRACQCKRHFRDDIVSTKFGSDFSTQNIGGCSEIWGFWMPYVMHIPLHIYHDQMP